MISLFEKLIWPGQSLIWPDLTYQDFVPDLTWWIFWKAQQDSRSINNFWIWCWHFCNFVCWKQFLSHSTPPLTRYPKNHLHPLYPSSISRLSLITRWASKILPGRKKTIFRKLLGKVWVKKKDLIVSLFKSNAIKFNSIVNQTSCGINYC